jgi:hypothetical protein
MRSDPHPGQEHKHVIALESKYCPIRRILSKDDVVDSETHTEGWGGKSVLKFLDGLGLSVITLLPSSEPADME